MAQDFVHLLTLVLAMSVISQTKEIWTERQMAVTEDPVQWRALVFVVFSLQVLLQQRARLYGDGF